MAGTTCAVCAIHRLTAEGKGLLEGLSMACQLTGGIPPGLGGTIPLALQTFVQADETASRFTPATVEESSQLLELRSALNNLIRYMRAVGQAGCGQVQRAYQMAQQVWVSAYQLAWMVYAR